MSADTGTGCGWDHKGRRIWLYGYMCAWQVHFTHFRNAFIWRKHMQKYRYKGWSTSVLTGHSSVVRIARMSVHMVEDKYSTRYGTEQFY